MTRAVIFDLDGTLVDTLSDIAGSLNHVLAQAGRETFDRDTIRAFIGHGARELVAGAAEAGDPDIDGRDIDALTEAFRVHYTANLIALSAPFPGVDSLLDELIARDVPVAILSNKPHAMVQTIVERFFSRVPFVEAWGVGGAVVPKPDPSAALAIAEKFAIPAHDVAYVGDSEVDVQTAQAAGMRGVAVAWGFRTAAMLKAELGERDVLVREVAELRSALG